MTQLIQEVGDHKDAVSCTQCESSLLLDGSVAGIAVRALSQRFEMICHTNVNERLLIWMRNVLKGSDLDVIARRSPAVALSFPSL